MCVYCTICFFVYILLTANLTRECESLVSELLDFLPKYTHCTYTIQIIVHVCVDEKLKLNVHVLIGCTPTVVSHESDVHVGMRKAVVQPKLSEPAGTRQKRPDK